MLASAMPLPVVAAPGGGSGLLTSMRSRPPSADTANRTTPPHPLSSTTFPDAIMPNQRSNIVVLGLSAAILSLGGLCTLAGCSGSVGGRGGMFTIEGTAVRATGEWSDVDAAVMAAAGHRGVVVESVNTTDPTAFDYRLITSKQEDIALVITRDKAPDPTQRLSQEGPIPLRISCRVGTFGDSVLERDLIDNIRSRLGELTGAFTSKPLPSGW